MKIYVTMKSLGKRKEFLKNVEFELNKVPETISELISALVSINVQSFNDQHQAENPLVQFLTKEEITQSGTQGKVGFAASYNEAKADEEEAIQTALQAFEDGLFKVFINDTEHVIESPSIQVNDGDQLVFIKLTMLAGRMW